MKPRFPVYVISKGRANNCLTARFLIRDGVPFKLVVEPQEVDAYARDFADHLAVLPFSNLGLGSIPARNWVWEDAIAAGAERHWILDDNMRDIKRPYKRKRIRCDSGTAIRAMEDFVCRYENVAIAGPNYVTFWTPDCAPFYRNVHVYSFLLIKNDLPYRWRGRYNEDTDLCLQVLSNGWCTVLFNAFLTEKMATMTMKGGNSDQLYKGDGRLKMARSLERMWPYVVTTRRKYDRPQHYVKNSWKYFDTPLVRKADVVVPEGVNDYGLVLVQKVEEIKSPFVRGLLDASGGEKRIEPKRAPCRAKTSEPKRAKQFPNGGALPAIGSDGHIDVGQFGTFRPWVWSVELVRGCNLACWHCTARIFPSDGVKRFMAQDTFGALCEVMAKATPGRRLEFAQGGEPTLHPHLLENLRMVRKISPTTQVQVTTNGLNLQNGNYNFRELFDAGAHSVYVDMYAPFEKYQKMAEASGAEWYHYNKPNVGNTKRRANTYYGDPNMRLIILQDSPHDRIKWRKMGRLSTFLNHIDWPTAMPFGLVPVREPYKRKCTLPMRYVSTTWEGDYIFCCIDFCGESAGLLGNVKDGPGAFSSYWFGRLVQSIRRRLVVADRAGVPYCSRCDCAFSKCDWVGMWPSDAYDKFWNGTEWSAMPSIESDDEVFADGWEKARSLIIPTQAEEDECLRTSKRRVIHTRSTRKKV